MSADSVGRCKSPLLLETRDQSVDSRNSRYHTWLCQSGSLWFDLAQIADVMTLSNGQGPCAAAHRVPVVRLHRCAPPVPPDQHAPLAPGDFSVRLPHLAHVPYQTHDHAESSSSPLLIFCLSPSAASLYGLLTTSARSVLQPGMPLAREASHERGRIPIDIGKQRSCDTFWR